MGNPNHHVSIHGHFYQPPRENPWLGVIEPQESAAPYRDWNTRITAENYAALTCSAVTGSTGRTKDLFNCYAHMSFNFGPTLLEWLEKHSPATLERIETADQLARDTYNDNGSAMAQVYNHQILPLADSRDKHTQIIWGLREFEYRFRRPAQSIWLSETAIDMKTVSALIDHNIKYIILSPLQASYVRHFSDCEWTGVPDGTIETKHPYRLFESDSEGNTHYDRFIDVIFYDKELSTSVSFEHLLSDAQKLEWRIRERMDDDAELPQLVVIATDGEIYGHHEKHGNRALAYFFNEMLNTGRLATTNLSLFLQENTPCWEVKLWEGLDGKGSSWSCEHGVSRWESDCGCGDCPPEWNQEWRQHLRATFDELRGHIREIFRREGGALFNDAFDARNDYISVILDESPESREAFLARHAQRELTEEEKTIAWSLLEADRNAMLMYTSCGWFFTELSGLEPVQNMRYALRAAELVAPWSKGDLVKMLELRMMKAKSNIKEQGTGADIFTNHVLTTRYGPREITAVHALCSLCNISEPSYMTNITLKADKKTAKDNFLCQTGTAEAVDRMTFVTNSFYYIAAAFKNGQAGVWLSTSEGEYQKALKLNESKLLAAIQKDGITLESLPYSDRERLAGQLLKAALEKAESSLAEYFTQHKALLENITRTRLPLPNYLKAVGEEALNEELIKIVNEALNEKHISKTTQDKITALHATATNCGLTINKTIPSRLLAKVVQERLESLLSDLSIQNIEDAISTVSFIHKNGFWLENWDQLQDQYWRILHLPPRKTPKSRKIVDLMRTLGEEFYFAPDVIKSKTQTLFSTPV